MNTTHLQHLAKEWRFREINHEVMTDTLKNCETNERLLWSILNTIKNTVIYFERENIEIKPQYSKSKIIVSNKRSFEAAEQYKGFKTAVLNFANSHSPWWAPFSSWAQEESLCRCSTLYPCLKTDDNLERYYMYHIDKYSRWETWLYWNDDIIYLPDITVFKTDESIPQLRDEWEWFNVDIITAAAPELFKITKYDTSKYEIMMRQRIKRILDVAALNNIEALILWAFWCWAFMNPPKIVARLFKEELSNYNFKIVEFPVFTNDFWPLNNYSIFKEIITWEKDTEEDYYNLHRFKEAQANSYKTALEEIRHWRKETHWMWYIFPQIVWLGHSTISKKYSISSLEEAKAYLKDKELRDHLIEISLALLDLKENISEDIFWIIDAMKLQSCMTLFAQAEPDNDIFTSVLNKFYNWEFDLKTLSILGVLGEELHAKLEKRKYSWKEIWKDSEEYKQLKEKRDNFIKKIKM